MSTRRLLVLACLTLAIVAGSVKRAHVAADGLGYEVTNTGWATHHVTVPDSLNCADGLEIGGFDTQTDVTKRWPASGDIEQAIVTYNATSTGNKTVACGDASGAVFGTPTNPSGTVTITTRGNNTWVNHNTITLAGNGTGGGTTYYYRLATEDASGNISFPSSIEKTLNWNATLDETNFIRATWTAISGATRYHLYRGTSANTAQEICDVASPAVTCDDIGQVASGAYKTSTDDDANKVVYTFTLPAFEIATGCLVDGVEAVGQTAITIDTCTGTLRRGDEITFSGHSQRYRVVGTPTATAITIYPALKVEAANNATITVFERLTGPHVRERRYVVKADTAGIIQDLIEVWFDVRSYSDGEWDIDVQASNMLDVASARILVYDVDINFAGGAVEYTKDAHTMGWATRWRGHRSNGVPKFVSATFDPGTVVHDFQYDTDAKLVPTFHSSLTDIDWGASDTSAYNIGGFGDHNSLMSPGGFRAAIGFAPAQWATYLVHKNPTTHTRIIANGSISGTWSGHITKADGGSLSKFDNQSYWYHEGCENLAPNGPAVCASTSDFLPVNWDGSDRDLAGSNAHIWNMNFLPALLTGDRWHDDQVRLWAHQNTLRVWPNWLAGLEGTLVISGNQMRGMAWGLRGIWYAVALLDDNDPDMPAFEYQLDLNMDAINGLDDPGALDHPFATLWSVADVLKQASPLQCWLRYNSNWQIDYVVNVLEMVHAWDGLRGGQWPTTKRDAILTYLARFVNAEATPNVEWPRIYARHTSNAIGYREGAGGTTCSNLSGPTDTYFDSLEEMVGGYANPTPPATPTDSGSGLTIHATTTTWINPDETVALAIGTVIQITGGAGCTPGFYRLHTSQPAGYWDTTVAAGTAGSTCTWKNRTPEGFNAPSPRIADGVGYVGMLGRATTELAYREGIEGAEDALAWINNYPGVQTDLNGDTRVMGYAVDYADPVAGGATSGSRVRMRGRRLR